MSIIFLASFKRGEKMLHAPVFTLDSQINFNAAKCLIWISG